MLPIQVLLCCFVIFLVIFGPASGQSQSFQRDQSGRSLGEIKPFRVLVAGQQRDHANRVRPKHHFRMVSAAPPVPSMAPTRSPFEQPTPAPYRSAKRQQQQTNAMSWSLDRKYQNLLLAPVVCAVFYLSAYILNKAAEVLWLMLGPSMWTRILGRGLVDNTGPMRHIPKLSWAWWQPIDRKYCDFGLNLVGSLLTVAWFALLWMGVVAVRVNPDSFLWKYKSRTEKYGHVLLTVLVHILGALFVRDQWSEVCRVWQDGPSSGVTNAMTIRHQCVLVGTIFLVAGDWILREIRHSNFK
jgi:hypothetical protein